MLEFIVASVVIMSGENRVRDKALHVAAKRHGSLLLACVLVGCCVANVICDNSRTRLAESTMKIILTVVNFLLNIVPQLV